LLRCAAPRSQVLIAVHERALFDYLTLELSPAFPGDSLIAVEITRTFEGQAVATRRAFGFEDDQVDRGLICWRP
jgi:exonuclease SbcC